MKILKFYSPTCSPCKQLDKVLKSINAKYQDINVVDDDIIEGLGRVDDLIEKYNISSIPVLIKLNDDGVEIERKKGLLTLEQVKEFYGN